MRKKKDIKPRNDKGEQHGYWKKYHWGGDNLLFKCFFHNGKRVGYEEWYDYRYTYDKLINKTYHI
jgi:hypothetical protein